MTRAGVDLTTSEGNGDLPEFEVAFTRLQIWQSLCKLIKWGRLYGGALGVMQIEGQDLSTPLDVETIGPGQFKGIIVFDRWQLNPVLTPTIGIGPDMGLPMFYQIVNNPQSYDPLIGGAVIGTENNTVHYTRCFRYTGHDLPFFQSITEIMWGESIIERLWDRLIMFDNASLSSGQLIDKANLRTIGIDGLREIIAGGDEAIQGLTQMFQMMRQLQVNEGVTLLDKDDTFASTSYAFAGLSDMLLQFGQQMAGSGGVPLIRLFEQSPAGLNSTGESDLQMYYDNINSQQESKLRNPFSVLLKVMWASEFGKPAPKDLRFKFNSLWQMDATDKANIAKTTSDAITSVFEAGLISEKTAMTELRDSSGDHGLFSNITDEDIESADEEIPEPDKMEPTQMTGVPPKEEPKAPPTKDGRIKKWLSRK